jgi:hypothetical protein
MEQIHNNNEKLNYGFYILTWLGLIVITAISIAIGGIKSDSVTVWSVFILTGAQLYLILKNMALLNIGNKKLKALLPVAGIVILLVLVILFYDTKHF